MNLDGEIIETIPEKTLVTTFKATGHRTARPPGSVRDRAAGRSVPAPLTHYDYEKSKAGVEDGWPLIVAGLKTLLETGKSLVLPNMGTTQPTGDGK